MLYQSGKKSACIIGQTTPMQVHYHSTDGLQNDKSPQGDTSAGHYTVYSSNSLTNNSDQILTVCFVALRPKSAAMVMAGHLPHVFTGQA